MTSLELIQKWSMAKGRPRGALLTCPDMADILRVSRPQAYAMASSGMIRSVRIGRSVRITPEALAELIDAGERNA
jgi:excisionase family DNA binding protein